MPVNYRVSSHHSGASGPRNARPRHVETETVNQSKSEVDSSHSIVSHTGPGNSSRFRAAMLECAPHPWSMLTTDPSDGEYALVHAPKSTPMLACSRTKKPQVSQTSGASRVISLSGPPGPASQRSIA